MFNRLHGVGRLIVMVAVVVGVAGCLVDEQEPGPNVHEFKSDGDNFAGRGTISSGTDSNDEWYLTPAPGNAGRFQIGIKLAPGLRAGVERVPDTVEFYTCPGTTECTFTLSHFTVTAATSIYISTP